MQPLWQLYDEDGQPMHGKGAAKQDVFKHGLLHGAAHVWMWRKNNGAIEVLLQKRAAHKQTWPGLLDISAAGHIDLGEDPIAAALREAKEEIGITLDSKVLKQIGTEKIHSIAERGEIENEFQWIYIYELQPNVKFILQKNEVESLEWRGLEAFENEYANGEIYTPHSREYYQQLITAIRTTAVLL